MKTFIAFIAFVLLVMSFTRPNFGFVNPQSAEAFGANLATLLIYGGSLWFLYRFFKQEKKK